MSHNDFIANGASESDGASSPWVSAFWIGIAAAYALLFLVFFDRVGGNDNDQFLVFHELQFWGSRLFGFPKQWSPVMGAGFSTAADPQVPLLSLTMALGYVFGPFAGLRAGTILYFAIGWIGAFLFSGLCVRRFAVRALAASLFIGNGFFVCRLGHGHIDAIPFLTLPLALWTLHRAAAGPKRGIVAASLLLGALFAVAIDGAPVAIIHYLFWVGVYAAALAWALRSAAPVATLALSGIVCALLGAGYLLPMLVGQGEFPRLTQDAFTNPLSLLWFMLVPATGKVIPAPANGHEYSVFIGPVLLWMMWRTRAAWRGAIPRSVGLPLAAAGAVSIVLGMGNLTALGVPAWLSPYDWLRPLPGFRSIGVSGRYWGFLALPLSLIGAMAFAQFSALAVRGRRWIAAALGAAVLLQIGFQARSFIANIGLSRRYEPIAYRNLFPPEGARIEYIEIDEPLYQGRYITPTVGVINAYNMGDFLRPDIPPGDDLVREVRVDGQRMRHAGHLDARFLSWNRIRIAPLRDAPDLPLEPSAAISIALNQAWNRNWRASRGTVARAPSDHLVVELSAADLDGGDFVLEFSDPSSVAGARIARWAWLAWAPLALWGLTWKRRR